MPIFPDYSLIMGKYNYYKKLFYIIFKLIKFIFYVKIFHLKIGLFLYKKFM